MEKGLAIRAALKAYRDFESQMERVRTIMAADEMAKDVRFIRTGPDSIGMMTKGDHYAGQELKAGSATADSEAEDAGTDPGPFADSGIGEDNPTGFPDEASGPVADLLGKLFGGDIEGAKQMIRDTMPKPCPATVAILRFNHSEMIDHVETVGMMAMEAGNLREAITAAAICKWIEKSLAQLNEAAEGIESPELTYDYLHSVMSVSDPAWVCEAQSKANAEAGFDATATTETVRDILNRQPGKKDRSKAVKAEGK